MPSKLKYVGFLLFILLLIACYHDINTDHDLQSARIQHPHSSNYDNKQLNFQVISYRIQPGEQLLPILEKLNPQSLVNIEQSVIDFKALNPAADIYQLENNRSYLFPLYH